MIEKIQLWTHIISAATLILTVYIFYDVKFHPRYGKTVRFIFLPIFAALLVLTYIKMEALILRTLFVYICILFSGFLFDTKWYNKVLYSALFLATSIAAEYIAEALILIFVFKGEHPSASDIVLKSSLNRYLVYIFKALITRVLELVAVMLWKIKRQKLLSEYEPKLIIMLTAIPFFSVGVILSLHNYLMFYETDETELFYAVVCAAFIVASNLTVFYILNILQENNVSAHAVYAANKLIEHRTEQYEELLSNQEKILKLHHDYKKFFTGLVASFDETNITKTRAEIMRQYEELTKLSAPVQGGNILQIILNMKEKVMSRNYIVARLEYKELYKSRISPIDTAIIFGNALDNAIEACMEFPTDEKKVIDVYGEVKNNIVVFVIKNPVVRNIDVKNLKTTKSTFGHGYGIISMQNIAQKYGGDISFECKDRVFTTYIMMRNG